MTSRRRGFLVLLLFFLAAGAAAVLLRKAPAPASPKAAPGGKVAVVDFYGPISISSGRLAASDVDRAVKRLRDLRKRDDVRGILLRVNSPGGSVAAVQEIHEEVVALKKAGKVIVASFGDVAASGGYYIAAPADKIVANPGTIVGSIGVIFQLGNVQELFRKVGLRMETIKAGAMKDMGSPFRPISEKERAHVQNLVNNAYDQFFQAVAEGRKLPPEKLKPLADGRIFTGAQAKDAGLVDELGNAQTALELLRKLANVPEEAAPVEFAASPLSRLMDFLESRWAPLTLPVDWRAAKVRFEYVWE